MRVLMPIVALILLSALNPSATAQQSVLHIGTLHAVPGERPIERATVLVVDGTVDRVERGYLSPEDLGVDVTPRLVYTKFEEPPKRQAGVRVGSVEELVDKLKNEAGVI